jgi:hypothetical protein
MYSRLTPKYRSIPWCDRRAFTLVVYFCLSEIIRSTTFISLAVSKNRNALLFITKHGWPAPSSSSEDGSLSRGGSRERFLIRSNWIFVQAERTRTSALIPSRCVYPPCRRPQTLRPPLTNLTFSGRSQVAGACGRWIKMAAKVSRAVGGLLSTSDRTEGPHLGPIFKPAHVPQKCR